VYVFVLAMLAALRRRLTAAIHDFQGAHAQYEEVIMHGLDLEAVVKCRQAHCCFCFSHLYFCLVQHMPCNSVHKCLSRLLSTCLAQVPQQM
jgi:hypothetical protein